MELDHTSDAGAGRTRQATAKQGFVIQLASSLTIMGAVMIAPMLPKIGAEFGPTTPGATELVPLVATAPALAIAIFAPIAGWLADRFGRKMLLLAGSILYAVLGFLPAILSDLHSILIARLAFGCTEAVIMTCCTTLIADYWTGEDRSRYINRQVVTIGIVGAAFFVVGGAVGETDWRLPFYLYLLPLLLVPFIAKVLWEPERRIEKASATTTAPRSQIARTIFSAYFLVFMGMVAVFVVPVMAPGLLVALGVTSSSLIGLCTGLGLLATLGGSIAWPFARRLLGIAGVNTLLLALIGLGLWLLATATSYTAVLIAVAIHGFGAGFLVPNSSLPLLHGLPEKFRARGVGGYTSCLYMGQFVSPLVVLAITPAFGGAPQGIPGAIIAWAAVMATLAAIWLGVRYTTPMPKATPAAD